MIASSIRDASSEATPDARLIEFLADEHELAHSALARIPEPVGPRVEHHLDPLKDDSLGLAPDLENPLASINLLAHLANHFAEPRLDLLQVQRPIVADVKRRHALVVVRVDMPGLLLFANGLMLAMPVGMVAVGMIVPV